MSVELRVFDPEHLDGFVPGRVEMETVYQVGDIKTYGRYLSKQGPAWSAFDSQGRFLGAGGLGYYWAGTAEGWLILSKRTNDYPLSLHRIVQAMILRAFGIDGLRRLQVMVPEDSTRSIRWIERLGFTRETTDKGMPGYGPDGKTYHLFSIVRE